MVGSRLRCIDYRGVTAVILSVGTVVALNALVRNKGGGSSVDTTLMATIFGGIIGCLGSYLGSALPHRPRNDSDEVEG